jgi:hypothetical protein
VRALRDRCAQHAVLDIASAKSPVREVKHRKRGVIVKHSVAATIGSNALQLEEQEDDVVTLRGEGLTIADIARVAEGGRVAVTDDEHVQRKVRASRDYIARAVENDLPIYGVTTCVGGMADQTV